MTESESVALPLGDAAMIFLRVAFAIIYNGEGFVKSFSLFFLTKNVFSVILCAV